MQGIFLLRLLQLTCLFLFILYFTLAYTKIKKKNKIKFQGQYNKKEQPQH